MLGVSHSSSVWSQYVVVHFFTTIARRRRRCCEREKERERERERETFVFESRSSSKSRNVLGFSASEFSVSRIRCVSFGDFGPRKTYF